MNETTPEIEYLQSVTVGNGHVPFLFAYYVWNDTRVNVIKLRKRCHPERAKASRRILALINC